MLQDEVDVDGLARDRALVREHLHAIDELDDAVGLLADQLGQLTVLVVGRLLQELRRAADAGQRVLDLVREHGRKRGHRAGRAPMGQLAIHLGGDRALLQHDDDAARPVEERRDLDVDEPLAEALGAEVDAVFVDRRVALADLLDQRQQWRAEGQQVLQQVAPHHRRADVEEGFRGHVGVDHAARRRRPTGPHEAAH